MSAVLPPAWWTPPPSYGLPLPEPGRRDVLCGRCGRRFPPERLMDHCTVAHVGEPMQ